MKTANPSWDNDRIEPAQILDQTAVECFSRRMTNTECLVSTTDLIQVTYRQKWVLETSICINALMIFLQSGQHVHSNLNRWKIHQVTEQISGRQLVRLVVEHKRRYIWFAFPETDHSSFTLEFWNRSEKFYLISPPPSEKSTALKPDPVSLSNLDHQS